MAKTLAILLFTLGIAAFLAWELRTTRKTGEVPGGRGWAATTKAADPGRFWTYVGALGIFICASFFFIAIDIASLVPGLPSHLPKTLRYGMLTADDAADLIQKHLESDPCVSTMGLRNLQSRSAVGDWNNYAVKVEMTFGPIRPSARAAGAKPCYVRNRLHWLADIGPAIDRGHIVSVSEPFNLTLTDAGWRIANTDGPR